MARTILYRQSKQYLLIQFVCIFTLPLMVLLIDPLAFLPTPSPLTKYYARGSRIEKAWPLILNNYETLLAGTSRVQIGLDPKHPHFQPGKAYNLGLPTSAMPEVAQSLLFAHDYQQPKNLVLGLDFIAFNTRMPFHAEWEQSLFSGLRGYLLGIRDYAMNPLALAYAFNNVRLNILGNDKPYSDEYGFLDKSEVEIDHHQIFRRVMTTQYLVLRNFYADYDYNEQAIAKLEDVLTRFAKEGTDIKLYISPIHVRHIEAIMGLGLYPAFEHWKRQLVEMTARVAANSKGKIALWDFNVYSEVTCEDVPKGGEKGKRMQWYFESSHFNKYAGNLVIETLFGLPRNTGFNTPFGYRLSGENIEEHLQRVRSQRLVYNAANKEAITDMEFLIEVTKKKREDLRAEQR